MTKAPDEDRKEPNKQTRAVNLAAEPTEALEVDAPEAGVEDPQLKGELSGMQDAKASGLSIESALHLGIGSGSGDTVTASEPEHTTNSNGPDTNRTALAKAVEPDLVKAIPRKVLALYQADTPETKFESILGIYATNAVFEDPLVKVTGRVSIRQQFWAVRNFLIGEILNYRVFEDMGTLRSRSPDIRCFAVEVLIRYRISSLLPTQLGLTIKQTTIIEVNASEEGMPRIHKHRDYWSLFETIEALPIVGTCYTVAKSTLGMLSTITFQLTFGCCKRRI